VKSPHTVQAVHRVISNPRCVVCILSMTSSATIDQL